MRGMRSSFQPESMSLVPHEKHSAFGHMPEPRYSGPDRREIHLVEPEATDEHVLNIGLWAVIVASLILDILAFIGACDVWRRLHG